MTISPEKSAAATCIERAAADLRAGNQIIITGDDGRGSLFSLADRAAPQTVNFMAKHGRGLVCLALTEERAQALGIDRQDYCDRSHRRPAFGVSIEASQGVSTGISAFDRATTIAAAASEDAVPADLVSPGHVFPVIAARGGIFSRLAPEEAAVDLARLSGSLPMGVLCHILDQRGEPAGERDIAVFARAHGLTMISSRSIAERRAELEPALWRCSEEIFDADMGGEWRLLRYEAVDGRLFVALQRGPACGPVPMFVAWHHTALLDEMVGRSSEENPTLRIIMQEASTKGPALIAFASPDQIATSRGECLDERAPLNDATFVIRQILADIQRDSGAKLHSRSA